MTTGTLAVSGVALAACAAPGSTPGQSDSSSVNPATAPLALAPAQKPLQINLEIPTPADRTMAGMLVGPDTTVRPGAPTELKLLLFNSKTRKGIANAPVRIKRWMPSHQWYTTAIVHTDARGWARYSAKVLTTTKLTAFFEGNLDFTPTLAANNETINVYMPPPPPPPAPRVQELVVTAPSTHTTQTLASSPVQVQPPTQSAPSSGIGAQAVNVAERYLGTPYVWGGSAPGGFDCSGLTQYVYAQLGRSLPRTTDEQYAASTHISQDGKQVGDLIFFGTPGSIGHMGIYIGNNQIIHAPSSGDVVKITTIWTSGYMVGRP